MGGGSDESGMTCARHGEDAPKTHGQRMIPKAELISLAAFGSP